MHTYEYTCMYTCIYVRVYTLTEDYETQEIIHIKQHMVKEKEKKSKITMWWVDPGWMLGAHQNRSISPPSQLDGGKKYNENLLGRGKDRERSFSNYCHRENRLNLEKII